MYGRLRVLSVPSFRQVVDQERDKKYTAYQIQIVYNGTIKSLEKRYSEILELHKRMQKTMTLRADFPTRMALSKDHKFLESRRQGLENYLQAVIHEGYEELPVEVYNFFEVGPLTQQTKSMEDSDSIDGELEPQRPVSNHQPVIFFDKNLFLELSPQEIEEEKQLLDVVLQGSLDGFYEEN
ncbi:sorting nexin-24-like [Rhopilema esculentum]|uniref:sorting nexin-24-like n=1 Tax=Rhopilema esculentum TaxID=499914 RepID=UPI0031E06F15